MSNTAKHTPGPWRIGAHDSCVPDSIIAGHYELVADVAGMPGSAEHDANARLIAAAPELLECCREALEIVDPDTAARIRAAIAKATRGEEAG